MFRTSVPATGAAFFDRTVELARIEGLLGRGRKTAPEWLAIIGPRKVGKTSLIMEWERRLSDPDIACVVIDVMDVSPPSREVFRTCALRVVDRVLGTETGVDLAELERRPSEYRAALQRSTRFGKLSVALRTTILELPECTLDGPGVKACLDLPEQLAKALAMRLVIAIDEFQELAPLDPYATMRSVWQRHHHVAYVISGSARTMLTELVTSEASPFFQHFALIDLGELARDDAIALLVESAPPDRAIDRELAARVVDVVGGHPFYLQLLGDTLTMMAAPLDDIAFKEALGHLVFTRTGRLALYFENEYRRAVGRAGSLAAVLLALADGAKRLGELATAIGAASGAAISYLERLGDVVVRDGDAWRISDPVFALWLKWRSPGGAAVPMAVIGDEAERAVAEHLARLGFDLVYQSRASRGAFDLLATRGADQLGIQVKRSHVPVRIPGVAWKRMHAEGKRLGWRWIVAVSAPDGTIHFLDPSKGKTNRAAVSLSAACTIDNLLSWLDRGVRRPSRRRK